MPCFITMIVVIQCYIVCRDILYMCTHHCDALDYNKKN